MASKFIDNIRRMGGETLWALMGANLLVFIVMHVAALFGTGEGAIAAAVALPASPALALAHPWTLAMYMFTQWDFMHLLSNMLWLWLFGMMAVRLGITSRRILTAYLLGGLVAGVTFIMLGAAGVTGGILIGSSCSVLSVVAMTGILRGRTRIQLMLLGEMQVRWLALITIVLVMLTSVTVQSTGMTLTHAAGALAGVGLAMLYQRNPRTRKVYGDADGRPRGNRYGPYPKRGLTPSEQAELDRLLEDVKRNGYAGISPAARARLFELSSRIR